MNTETIITTLNRILAERGVEITKWREELENERDSNQSNH